MFLIIILSINLLQVSVKGISNSSTQFGKAAEFQKMVKTYEKRKKRKMEMLNAIKAVDTVRVGF